MKNSEVLEWIRLAEADLETAEILYKQKATPGHIIFHCHEFLEKYLKAIMIHHGVDFPYVHQLEYLIDLAPIDKEDLLRIENVAIMIDELYVVARYPSKGKIMRGEAHSVLKETQKMKELLLFYLL
jgi:HEPN domain-containing protein